MSSQDNLPSVPISLQYAPCKVPAVLDTDSTSDKATEPVGTTSAAYNNASSFALALNSSCNDLLVMCMLC